jgi:hypothetical protein
MKMNGSSLFIPLDIVHHYPMWLQQKRANMQG